MVSDVNNKEFKKALGIVLKTVRKLRGHKVIVVHKSTGISETSITSWETGRHGPSIDNLNILARFYNIQLSTIIMNTEKTLIKLQQEKHPLASKVEKSIIVGDNR